MSVLAGRGPRTPTDGAHTHAPSDRTHTHAPSDPTRAPAGDDDSDGAPTCLHQLTICFE